MKDKKKVLIVTYYWPPSGGAGVQRWLKFAKYLPNFDIDPIILTVDSKFASYPQIDTSLKEDLDSELKVFKTKSFEPLSLLSGLFGTKNVPYGGFTNVNKKSFLQTILRFVRGNFFIPDARKGWNKYAYKEAKELITKYNIQTIITTGPPHSTHLIGLKLKRILQVNWIADFRDPWTDIYYYKDLLHTGLAKRIDKKKEKKVLQYADKIIVVGKTLKEKLQSKIKHDKFEIISNGFDEDDFKGFEKLRQDKFTITYTGTLSDQYNITSFIEALKKLKTIEKDFLIRFVGNISQTQIELFYKAGLKNNLEIVSYLPHQESIEFLHKSSVLLLAIPDFNGNEEIITGKLFEYLATKNPIIGIGPVNGDAANIIRECNSGEMFDYSESNHVYEYLLKLMDEKKISNDLSLYKKYSRKNLTQKLKEFIEND